MNTRCVHGTSKHPHMCMHIWPGDLLKYCDGCINYAKQKVIEKYSGRPQ